MKTDRLLATLERQISDLDRLIAPLAAHMSLTPRFDRLRFRTNGKRMADYLHEVHDNLAQLRHCVDENEPAQTAWLAEKLVEQVVALRREAAAWPVRYHDSAHYGFGKLHAKLLAHQEFERRLLAMQRERQLQVQNVEKLDEQQRLHREIDALEGRLARCREALYNIEAALTRLVR